MLFLGIKVYIVYYYILFRVGENHERQRKDRRNPFASHHRHVRRVSSFEEEIEQLSRSTKAEALKTASEQLCLAEVFAEFPFH